jgi:hypothetical protein
MAADGSLRFDTAVNTEGFKDGTSSIKKAADRCAKAVGAAGREINSLFSKPIQISSVENQIARTEARIKQLQAEIQHIGETEIPTDEYNTLSNAVEKTSKKLDGLLERQNKMEEQGVKKNSSRWKNLQYDIDETSQKLRIYQAELQDTINRDRAFTSGKESSSYQKKASDLEYLNNQLYIQKQRLMELIGKEGKAAKEASKLSAIAESAEVSNQKIVDLTRRLQQLQARQKELKSAGVGLGYAEYDRNASEIARMTAELKKYEASLVNTKAQTQQYVGVVASVKAAFAHLPVFFTVLGAKIANGFKVAPIKLFHLALNGVLGMARKVAVTMGTLGLKGIKAAASSATKALLKMSKAFLGLGKSAKKGNKGLSMFRMLGQSIMFSAVFRGLSAITRAFKDGIQGMAQYSSSFNVVMSSFTSSLSQFKYSFAAAFAPLTSVVVPALDILIQKLIQAINVIGQFLSAITGKSTFTRAKRVNKDYAASLKKTGGAAKQAGKDAKKALAPFDDLVQIQREGADGSSGGSGGGIDPSQMFETVAIDQGISDFANKLKELWQAGDWEGIGQLIGQKVNESVQKFTDYISWDNVGVKITAFVTAFTTLFNSLVANIDWYSIGIMMGTGINTLANTLYLLLTQIDWLMLGSALATGLNGMVATVDWNLFGATLGAFFQAKISGLYGFVDTADWPLIGQAIGNGLNGIISQIDWGMLGLLFATGLSGLFAIAGNFAQTFDWTGFGSSIALSLSTFFQTFDWAGSGTAISDFVLGLLNAFVTFIKETDWTALGTGVAEMALAIDWWGILLAVIDAVLQTLKAVVLASWGLLSEIGKSLWEGFCKGVKTFFSDPKAFIRDNIVDPFVKYFKELFGIHSPSTVMAEMGQYLWDGFCNGIKEFFSNPGAFIKANITDPFVNGLKSLLGIHSPSTVLAGIGSYTVQGFNQGVTSEQTASQNVVQSWASGVANWFSEKFGIGTGDSVESKKWANSIMSGFNNTVRKNYTQSQTVMETWAENVRKWFVGVDENQGVNELSWTKFADLIIQAFKAKIEGSHSETQGPVETWARNVREWFWGDSDPQGTGGMYAAFYDMAKRINEGFANGISDFAYMAKDAIRKWAAEAMEEAEEEFDINSPSREFYNIAEYVVRGFNNGIADMARSSRSIVQDWLDGVMDVFDGVQIRLPIGIDIPNAAAYLPKMARGSIVPPRAGDMAASMRSRSYAEEELLSNLIARLDTLLSQQQGDRSQPIQIVLNLTGSMAALARALKPELDREAARRGVSLVVIGGT